MMNEAIKKIQTLLEEAESSSIKDAAGIITAQGIDAAARARALKDCLKILFKEKTDANTF